MILTSIFFFIPMVLLFLATGHLFSRALPTYRKLIPHLLKKKGYSCELEGMRGILASCVVIHHAVVWYLLLYYRTSEITGPNHNFYSQLGVAPVTFFFFLTGFLFWSKLIFNPELPFARFAYARLLRLGPAYIGAVTFVFVLVAIFTDFHLHTSRTLLAHDMLRIMSAETAELNGFFAAPWLWGVTWTLKFEFLFYLLIPFLGWFAGTLRKSILFVSGCCILYSINRVILADLTRIPLGFSLFEGLVRYMAFIFCVGILTAQLVRIEKIRELGRSFWAAPLSLFLIAVTLCFVPAKHGPIESLFLAIPFVAVASGCTFWGALRSRAILFLGQISYSLYLVHCLVYGLILVPLYRILGPAMRDVRIYWTIMFLIAPVIIGVATLWHRIFELPFLTKSSGVTNPAVFVVAGSPLQAPSEAV